MAAVKTRKISELFRRGKELVIDDGESSPQTFWLQKLNPLESETAVRRANAARARFMLSRNDKESDIYLSVLNEVVDNSREDLIGFLSAQDVAQHLDALESEFTETNEWNKDDYLQGLNDAWDEELEERYMAQKSEGIEDAEAQRCFEELQRHRDEFSAMIAGEQEAASVAYQHRSLEELRELVVERMFKLQADLTWLTEYRKCELWMGTRVSKKDPTKVFDERREVDTIAGETIGLLVDGYVGMNIPVVEGKDLQATDTSSQQLKQQETQETDNSSGLEDVPE